MATITVGTRYTPEQYLALERAAATRSEYVDGDIYSMPGTSLVHNVIAGNLYRLIGNQLVDRTGGVYLPDLRVRIGQSWRYTYPDVVAVRGEPQLEDAELDTLLNPSMIAEVLSTSTEAYDRGDKFAAYRRIESLQDYVLMSQDQIRVERFTRRGEEWVLIELNRLEDVLRLDSIDCSAPRKLVVSGIDSQFLLSISWREQPAQVMGDPILMSRDGPHGPHRAPLLSEFPVSRCRHPRR